MGRTGDSTHMRHASGVFCVNKRDISYVMTTDGVAVYSSDDMHTAVNIQWKYDFSDMRRTDIVVDLGANVGGFAIRAARKTTRPVLAVEPVRYDELEYNVKLNQSLSIPVLQVIPVFGCYVPDTVKQDHKTMDIEYAGTVKRGVPCYTLGEIFARAGGCDFLKIDIEGHEFSIDPKYLKSVRRIEGQLHFDRCNDIYENPFFDYLMSNYSVYFTKNSPSDRVPIPPIPKRPDRYRPFFHAFRIDTGDCD